MYLNVLNPLVTKVSDTGYVDTERARWITYNLTFSGA